MKKAWILFMGFLLMGCATPATVKQALVDLDEGYVENLKLMQQSQWGSSIKKLALSRQNIRHRGLVLEIGRNESLAVQIIRVDCGLTLSPRAGSNTAVMRIGRW